MINSSDCNDNEVISHLDENPKMVLPISKRGKPLSELIKEARNSRGMSQREFAKRLGITQAQLCRLENNPDPHPTRKTLKALRPYVNLTYAQLLAAAGYKGAVLDDEDYSSSMEEAIDPVKVAEEIYRADPDFFEILKDFSCYGTPENIMVLKAIIRTMKITEMEVLTPANVNMKERFRFLKEYILGILSIPETT